MRARARDPSQSSLACPPPILGAGKAGEACIFRCTRAACAGTRGRPAHCTVRRDDGPTLQSRPRQRLSVRLHDRSHLILTLRIRHQSSSVRWRPRKERCVAEAERTRCLDDALDPTLLRRPPAIASTASLPCCQRGQQSCCSTDRAGGRTDRDGMRSLDSDGTLDQYSIATRREGCFRQDISAAKSGHSHMMERT